MLENGEVGGRQVAPEAFLRRSLDPVGRKTVATFAGIEVGYRSGWWILGDHDLIAMGAHTGCPADRGAGHSSGHLYAHSSLEADTRGASEIAVHNGC